jgi:hypothetical protein
MRRLFGDAALNIKMFGGTPEVAAAQLDALEEDGINPEMLAPYREAIIKNPASISGLVDSLLSQHPDEEVRKMVQTPKTPGTRQVEITNPDGSKTVRIVPDTPGQEFKSFAPPKEAKTENKMWVMRPGPDGKMSALFVPESQVKPGDQPATSRAGEGRPSNGVEKKALNFFNKLKQADEELANFSEKIAGQNLLEQGWMAVAPNPLQTDVGQKYLAAQRAFTEARLRKDSGAAIAAHEYANDRKTYFAQPGDSAETIKQKERGRAAILASMAFESGRALNEFYGEDADGMVEGYKQRQGQTAPLELGTRLPEGSRPSGSAKPSRMSATNPKTGEKLYSDDGGKTWHK